MLGAEEEVDPAGDDRALEAVARGHDLKWSGFRSWASVSIHLNYANSLNVFGGKQSGTVQENQGLVPPSFP